MAVKRKRKSTSQPADDLSKPTAWRKQHGGFEAARLDVDPDSGTTVSHHRAFDTLGVMLTNGTITPEMHDAGVLFRRQFRAAALDTLRSMPLIRIPGGNGDTVTEQNHAARRKVAAAMVALGGSGSIAGSCVWHVVGCECSVREWALRQGWGGRPLAPNQSQGVLLASLGVLAGHYGLGRTGLAA
ncbi:MAG: hypothetical protein NT133_00270 [Alphaproteobacteria bacterium]|nr:hypothetical protein [Alphaproteobacteria bacterium]